MLVMKQRERAVYSNVSDRAFATDLLVKIEKM
jgi:hypothetical protein